MDKMKVLCYVVSLPKDLNQQTIPSIKHQTVAVSKISLISEKVVGGSLPERLSFVLNKNLEKESLDNFDYFLRVDGDIVVPSDFLEKSLAETPDLVGTWDSCVLIKISSWKKIMNCKYVDNYIIYKFRKEGLDVKKYCVNPISTRKCGKFYSTNDYIDKGKNFWKLGYEPIHILHQCLTDDKRFVLSFFCYFIHFLRRTKKLDVAEFNQNHQIKRLFKWS